MKSSSQRRALVVPSSVMLGMVRARVENPYRERDPKHACCALLCNCDVVPILPFKVVVQTRVFVCAASEVTGHVKAAVEGRLLLELLSDRLLNCLQRSGACPEHESNVLVFRQNRTKLIRHPLPLPSLRPSVRPCMRACVRSFICLRVCLLALPACWRVCLLCSLNPPTRRLVLMIVGLNSGSCAHTHNHERPFQNACLPCSTSD